MLHLIILLQWLTTLVYGDVTYNITTLTGTQSNAQSNSNFRIQLFGEDGTSTTPALLEDPNKNVHEAGNIDKYSFSLAPIEDLAIISIIMTGKDKWCYTWISVTCVECRWSCNATRSLPCLDNHLTHNLTELTCLRNTGTVREASLHDAV